MKIKSFEDTKDDSIINNGELKKNMERYFKGAYEKLLKNVPKIK